RKSAPAPASPPSALLGPVPSEYQAAVSSHRPSVCIGAAPLPVDTPLRAAQRRSLRGRHRPHAARRRRASLHPRPPRPCSASLASTLPGERHSSRLGHTTRENAFPATAWPRPIAGVAVVALCRSAYVDRGCWDRTCRPCPRAYLLHPRDRPKAPSLRPRSSSRPSTVLRPPRTPAAHRSIWPSAYTTRLAVTAATQTGLSCSALLLQRVLLPVPRRNPRRVPVLAS